MASFPLTKELIKILDSVEGDTPDKKVINLVNGNAAFKLKECDEQIAKLEFKYGMTFDDFSSAWRNGKIAHKHSHQTEKDYMEWEGVEQEKNHWLSQLRTIKVKYLSKK